MLHEYGCCNGAYAAGNGSDSFNDGFNFVELSIACDTALAALCIGLFSVPVDGYVDDDLTGAYEISSQGVEYACSGYEDISLLADLSCVDCTCVACCNCSVLAHEHHACGLTNYERTADYDSVLTLAVDAVEIEDFHASCGCAGSETEIIKTFEYACVGKVCHAVNVLFGSEAVADFVLVSLEVLGKRTEHENAVDGFISINLIDYSENVFLCSVCGKYEVLYVNANEFSALCSASFVRKVRGIFANANDTECGNNAVSAESSCAFLQFRIQGIGNFLAQ